MKVESFIEQVASFLHFFCLYVGESYLLPCIEACFSELKTATTSEEFVMYGFDIWTYLCLLPSYLQGEIVPRKERPWHKGRKITLVSYNKISEV